MPVMAAHATSNVGPNLLCLPWDIRSLIYAALLTEDHRPCASPLDLPVTECIFPFWQPHSNFIHQPPPPTFICHGLLWTCRQTREELCGILEREQQRETLKCKMDCMALRTSELFPSWTWFPAPLRYLSKLEVDLRILSAGSGGHNVPRCSSGILNNPAFKLAELLEELFHRGPAYKPVKVLRNDVHIKGLVVNVIAPPELSEQGRNAPSVTPQDGSSHPADIYRSLTVYYILPRTLRAKVESISVYYADQEYHWNAVDEHKLWAPKARTTQKTPRQQPIDVSMVRPEGLRRSSRRSHRSSRAGNVGRLRD